MIDPIFDGTRFGGVALTVLAHMLLWTSSGVAVQNAQGAMATESVAPPDSSVVAAFVDSFFTARASEHEGVALAVVLPNGSTVLRGFAPALLDAPEPDRTVFRAASVGKLVVVTAVLQIVADGIVELDVPIDSYVPELDFDAAAPPPTLRQLMTHRAGIEDGMLGAVVSADRHLEPLASYFARRGSRVVRHPGPFVSYSNHGMAMAALVIEQAVGRSFHEIVQERIFDPLGMTSSSFLQPIPEELARDAAPFGFDTHVVPYPSGSLVTTAADMGRFVAAHLAVHNRRATRLPSANMLTQAHERQFGFHDAMPGIGLGFFESYLAETPGIFHTGLRYHSSILYLLPEQSLGFFLVGRMPEGGSIKADFAREFVERFGIRTLSTPAVSSTSTRGLIGYYRLHLGPTGTIEKIAGIAGEVAVQSRDEGSLELRFEFGGRPMTLTPVDSTLFRSEEGAYVAFQLDDAGKATGLAYQRATSDLMSGSRIRWIERGWVHLGSLLACVGVFLVFCVTSIVGTRANTRGHADPVWPWRIVWLVATLMVLGPSCLVAWLVINGGPNLDGVPRVFYLVTGFPTAGALLGVAIPVYAVAAWRRRYWSLRRRAMYTAVAAVTMVLSTIMFYWNVVGFQF